MGAPPTTGRWPRRLPGTDEGYYFVDNRNAATDKYDRRGPYLGSFVPADGQLQVPSSSKSGDAIMVMVDAHIWLPLSSDVKARSILTNVASNVGYSVLFAGRQGERIEALVQRRAPS